MAKYFDQRGQVVTLSGLIGEGGEGAVFEVAGHAQFVAKIYKKPASPDRADKLQAMIAAATEDLAKFAAWPLATLSQSPGGPICGAILPRVRDCSEVHNLYSPAHRKEKFPDADWAFLTHMAMNCAIAFEAIHASGQVIGDVNQGNLLASKRGTVFLIDCDSFQIASDGRLFHCDVGVPHFTPPELQGKSYRGLLRTTNHDCFGLAVLIFHLLFMGRHPYAGRYLGRGEMQIETAIAEYRYAYSRTARLLQMAPPPQTVDVAEVAPQVAVLLERAFCRGSEAPDARPSAREWRLALDALRQQLKTCPFDPGHKFPQHLAACPWCGLIRSGAPNFFISVSLAKMAAFAAQPGVDLGLLWQEIERVPRPASLALSESPLASFAARGQPLPPNLEDAHAMTIYLLIVAVGSALISLGGVLSIYFTIIALPVCVIFTAWCLVSFLTSGVLGERLRRHAALKRGQSALAGKKSDWAFAIRILEKQFNARLKALAAVRGEHPTLNARMQSELRKLEGHRERQQLRAYLAQQCIADHEIALIGPKRKDELAMYGIETALDVEWDRVRLIPNFSNVLTGSLVGWRRNLEARFRFDPAAAISPAETQGIYYRYAQLRQRLELELKGGPESLREILREAQAATSETQQQLGSLEAAVAQAQADLDVVAKGVKRTKRIKAK